MIMDSRFRGNDSTGVFSDRLLRGNDSTGVFSDRLLRGNDKSGVHSETGSLLRPYNIVL